MKKTRRPDALRLLDALSAIEHALDRHSKLMHQRDGLTGEQRLLLRHLAREPDVTLASLATTMHRTAGTLHGMVKTLEARGLVKREPDRLDARAWRLRPTALGRDLAAKTADTQEGLLRKAITALDRAQLQSSLDVLETLTRALNPQS